MLACALMLICTGESEQDNWLVLLHVIKAVIAFLYTYEIKRLVVGVGKPSFRNCLFYWKLLRLLDSLLLLDHTYYFITIYRM